MRATTSLYGQWFYEVCLPRPGFSDTGRTNHIATLYGGFPDPTAREWNRCTRCWRSAPVRDTSRPFWLKWEPGCITIERQKELYLVSQELLTSLGYRFTFFMATVTRDLPTYGPFDRILITAAAPEIPPKLLEQLKIGRQTGGTHRQARSPGDDPGGEKLGPVFIKLPSTVHLFLFLC